uniref:Uncharacterized protein MANES_03G054700 n=1 Tax=Rhizophora mucronata TaxID=61149 RepID=A0A2P2KVE0_RHIMU
MDPSIMKLLEEDEDESMHSGADVEAFQAALNRDIGGDVSTSQSSDTGTADILSQESNQNYSQPFLNWQTPRQDENASVPRQQDPQSVSVQQKQLQQQPQHLPVMELKQQASSAENEQHRNDISQEFNHLQPQQKQSQDSIQQRPGEQFPLQISQATTMRISEKSPIPGSEPGVQKMGNQQTTGMDSIEQAGNAKSHAKQIPFALLLPALKPHLDKDREMQLQTLFNKLRKNEVTKEQFVRLMRNIVGDQVLRLAVTQLQSQAASNQSQLPSQALARQHQARIPVSASSPQFTDSGSYVLHQKGSIPPSDSSHNPPLVVQMQTDAMPVGKKVQKPREAEHQPDSRGIQVSQMPSLVNQERESFSSSSQGNNVQQQQHVHFPQTSFPSYGSSSGNYRPYSGTISGASVKPQPHELKMRQISHHQSLGTAQIRGPSQAMGMVNAPKSVKDASKLQSGSISPYANKSGLQQTSVAWQAPTNIEQSSSPFSSTNYVKQEPIDQAAEQQQHKSLPSTSSSVSATVPVEQDSNVAANIKDESLEKQSSKVGFSMPAPTMPSVPVSRSITAQLTLNDQLGSRIPSASRAGANTRTPNSKTSIGQKKPLEALVSSPPLPSKKQKVSGAFLDQSIEQLNDVTAVSGVNLREEEEQLFSGPKEDSRASEASRRFVQEEEERMILQKIPLQKKLAEIMAKSGLKNISNDVERCLSMCVEERMRGLISNLIRLSKQRVDVEKARHRTLITSDVRQQVMTVNQKAREEWEKKQAGADKLRNFNEPEGDDRVEGDKEKDEGRVKSMKANKEEDDKMRTTAANVAARAAVGGDDMLSKWQLMAEQARQKREGGMEAASASQPAKDAIRKPLSTTGRNTKDNQEAEKRSPAAVTSASGKCIE